MPARGCRRGIAGASCSISPTSACLPGPATRCRCRASLPRKPRRVTAAAALRESPAGRVYELAVTPLEISATGIRAILAEGGEPRWLVPDALLSDPALLKPYRHLAGDR